MAGKHSQNMENKIDRGTNYKIKTKKSKPKKRRTLKIIGLILLVILIIIAGIGVGGYSYIMNKLNKMQQVEINVEELDVNEELKGYRNIAIFGVDSRDTNLGKGNRSDCIIIASINQETNDIKLLSVYRDTYVEIEGHGLDKITHAYSYGEAPLAIKTLNTNLDLNITEFVTVNFDLVADLINDIGGIQITLEQAEIKYINDYIDATATSTGISSSHVNKAGTQTLDGVQSVAYSRIRYTSGGDYKRTERMRDVLTAVFNKVKKMGIGEINNLLDKYLPRVYTNLNAGNILSLATNALSYNITDSVGWPYKTQGITLDRWYGVPVTLESNVKQLHEEVFEETDYEVPDKIKTISNKIITKTGYKQ